MPVPIEPAETAYQKIVTGAGCSLPRDSVDARLIAQLKSLGKEGRIVRDEHEAGGIGEFKIGTLPASSAGDNIPDAWKLAHHLDPKDTKLAGTIPEAGGYSVLEIYANDIGH